MIIHFLCIIIFPSLNLFTGHQVKILNIKDKEKIISKIKKRKPDILHIQYDNMVDIANSVKNDTRLILISNHNAFLMQRKLWIKDYFTHFNLIKSLLSYKNIYYASLTEATKNMFIEYGFNKEKIILCPNGASGSNFKYSKKPKYPNRSIYLAKIDSRSK